MHIDPNDMIFVSFKCALIKMDVIFESIKICSNIDANSFRPMMCQIQHAQRLQTLQVEKVTILDACHEVIFLFFIVSFILGLYQLIFPLVRNMLFPIFSILIITEHYVA